MIDTLNVGIASRTTRMSARPPIFIPARTSSVNRFAAQSAVPVKSILRILLLALFFLLPGIIPSAFSETKKLSVTKRRAPFGWLKTGTDAIILDIRQTGLSFETRDQAAVFCGAVASDLARAKFKVFLARSCVERELTLLHGARASNDKMRLFNALSECIKSSLETNSIDWQLLADADLKYRNNNAGLERFPWLMPTNPPVNLSYLHIQPKEMQNVPTLYVSLTWSSKAYQLTGNKLPGVETTVRGLSGSFALADANGRSSFRKDYQPEPFKSSYRWGDAPANEIMSQMQSDIHRGGNFEKVEPIKPSTTDVASLGDSRWRIDGPNGQFECTFNRRGTYNRFQYEKLFAGNHWEQEGDVIRLYDFESAIDYEGRLDGKGGIAGIARGSSGTRGWSGERLQK